MSDIIEFVSKKEFRQWLSENCQTSAGVCLLFGKSGGPKTIRAGGGVGRSSLVWLD